MKILTKNKIVEAYHFPFTEALIFSILLWTSWGLAEAFYWDRISQILNDGAQRLDSLIYLQAFFIYVAVAAFWACLIYVGMRIILALFHLHNTRTFRAFTLCGILAVFFIATLYHWFQGPLWNHYTANARYTFLGLLIAFALVLLVLLYRWGSSEDFRIRRSGTMMLSILVISAVLSFVPFPIFSQESGVGRQEEGHDGYRKLMAYRYLAPLIKQ